ncbi:MAG: alpha/beta hydrolase [Bacteroidota bacterium]
MKHRFTLCLFSFLTYLSLQAQQEVTSDYLMGSWEGAFIKNNAYQKIEIDFTQRNGKIYSFQTMEEWHPSFGEFEVPVKIDSTGTIRVGTGYGMAILTLDKNNLELIGQLTGFNPSIYIHLKKVPFKPKPTYTVEPVSITSGEVTLAGHLHTPNLGEKKTAVILVGGRGCYPDDTQYSLYAKFLRKYGVSVLAYQKRGTGTSTGDCSTATIQDLANDLVQVRKYVASHPNNYQNIGVLGISAGGWTMAKAEESTNFDFMISIVGPSTSVKDQQFQSLEYGAEFYKLESEAKEHLTAYTHLTFEAEPTAKDFKKMMDLLAGAEKESWRGLLDDTDIPKDAADIKNLWVRRHNYDPQATLAHYTQPFLAIYGDRDFIVPYKENIALLETYFADRPENLQTVVAFNAEHGMETEPKWVNLGNDQSYWHFYRISPQVRIELANFLRKHALID